MVRTLFSPVKGSKAKGGAVNMDSPLDLVSLAILLGATFVARSFSGDKQQLVPLIKAAISHQGSAVLDVISPCVTFNNHPGSTKSFEFVRDHDKAVNTLDYVPPKKEIAVDYDESVRAQLLEIAALYHQMDEIFGRRRPEYACAWSLMPWRIGGPDKWTPQMRRTQAQTLREVLAIERQAVSGIEKVLPLLDQPALSGKEIHHDEQ